MFDALPSRKHLIRTRGAFKSRVHVRDHLLDRVSFRELVQAARTDVRGLGLTIVLEAAKGDHFATKRAIELVIRCLGSLDTLWVAADHELSVEFQNVRQLNRADHRSVRLANQMIADILILPATATHAETLGLWRRRAGFVVLDGRSPDVEAAAEVARADSIPFRLWFGGLALISGVGDHGALGAAASHLSTFLSEVEDEKQHLALLPVLGGLFTARCFDFATATTFLDAADKCDWPADALGDFGFWCLTDESQNYALLSRRLWRDAVRSRCPIVRAHSGGAILLCKTDPGTSRALQFLESALRAAFATAPSNRNSRRAIDGICVEALLGAADAVAEFDTTMSDVFLAAKRDLLELAMTE